MPKPIQAQETFLDMAFPEKGISLFDGFDRQAKDTTPVGLNVRGYDPATGRLRGASRPGIARYIDSYVKAVDESIQDIDSVIATDGYLPGSQDLAILQIGATIRPTGTFSTGALSTALTLGSGFVVVVGSSTGHVTGISDTDGRTYTRASFTSRGGYYTSIWYSLDNQLASSGLTLTGTCAGGATTNIVVVEVSNLGAVDTTLTQDGTAAGGATETFDLGPVTPTSAPGIAFTSAASVAEFSTAAISGWTEIQDHTGEPVVFARKTAMIYSTTANVSITFPIVNSLAGQAWNGVTVLFTVAGQEIVDAMSMTSSPTEILIAVAGGTVKVKYEGVWTAVTDGSTALSTTAPVIRSYQNGGKLYFADGATWKYYDPSINSMVAWTASDGSLPGSNLSPVEYPRLIVTWRGRTVVSGLTGDPRNWFMSAVNDPRNWNYFPVPTVSTQAVVGNNSPLGLVGDVITCLIPYSDDVLIIGGDHTIWQMNGDPMAGGQINLVSDTIGIALGIPWCKDPMGTVYFVSNLMGVYSLVPGGKPVRISQNVEQLLAAYDPALVVFRMLWDDYNQGFHLFCTKFAAEATTPAQHFFWDMRNNAWWTDALARTEFDPKCCYSYHGNSIADRALLIGSWDGYVREFKNDVTEDDDKPIDSEVWIGPLLTRDMDDLLLKDIQVALGEDSGEVQYSVHVGATAEMASSSEAVETGTLASGRNLISFVRFSGHGIFVKLTSSNYWAMETIRARVAGKGKVRRRGY